MSGVDGSTRKEIDRIVERILRDGDLREPPVQIIDMAFMNLTNPRLF